MIANQFHYFTRLGVLAGLELGIHHGSVNFHFETSAIGGDESDGANFCFQGLQYIGCQANSPGSIVSDRAIGDGDLKGHGWFLINGLMGL